MQLDKWLICPILYYWEVSDVVPLRNSVNNYAVPYHLYLPIMGLFGLQGRDRHFT